MNSKNIVDLIQKMINSRRSTEDKEVLKKAINKQKLIPEILFLFALIFVAWFLVSGF